MRARLIFSILIIVILSSCDNKKSSEQSDTQMKDSTQQKPVVEKPLLQIESAEMQQANKFEQLADSAFVNLRALSDAFSYDMRYATANNFLEEKVYDCDNCWLRMEVARALVEANKEFMDQGLRIKFYDCFRPRQVQYKMWEILPDGRYVANPDRGSIHNRGAAVDITLVHSETNEELDMGTDFDFFGEKAHFAYKELPDTVLANRKLLRKVMEQSGFTGIRTEWWHFNLSNAKYPISNQALCNGQ